MKRITLSVFALLCGYLSTAQSQDTIITLEGDTSLVKVISISDNEVSYELPSSRGVTITKSLSTIESVGFSDSNMDDYLAPNNTLMNESFYIYSGYFQNSRFKITNPVLGFGADWYFYKGFGIDLDWGIGLNDQPETLSLIQFGIRAKYRINSATNNWFTTQSIGVRTFQLNRSGDPSDLIYEFTTAVGYTFNSGIELTLAIPLGVNKYTFLNVAPQLRIGFRF